jgi:hypothetical protein
MPLPLTFAGPSAVGGYSAKVLSYSPIAYWPLNETSGTTAICQVNAAQNGTYTGVTLGQPGIGDGNTAPFFDGANDYVNVQTAALAAAFNGAEGSISWWFKVYDAGVWTDGTFRYHVYGAADASNNVFYRRHTTNNWLTMWYRAGGTISQQAIVPEQPTTWTHIALTWSATDDAFKSYFAGVQAGPTISGLGIWAGPLADTVIGAGDLVPTSVWHGYLAHVAIYTSALSLATIQDLATV